MAANTLFRELAPGTNPLGPDNKLVFATGPLNTVGVPGDVRFVVAGMSPLTGIWGEANCSGWFGDALKKAGYDALIVEGTSESPVYIWINGENVEFRDAEHLRGKWTSETESLVKEELGHSEVAVIAQGPAAENLVRFSAVTHTAHRAAGRTGLGAVMGSKRLKAIAAKGEEKIKIEVADPGRIKELSRKIVAETFSNTSTKALRKYGQAGAIPDLQDQGILPTRNFRSGVFEGAGKISGQTMAETVRVDTEACPRCPVACKMVVEVKEGSFAPVGREYGGPEYENMAALGSLLGIDRLDAICRMNMLCNAYSLDTISTGVCIAFAMDCYENGILTKNDTNGLELTFGNADAAVEMVEKIALRDGLGDILADGVRRAAQKIGKGSERFAMHVKGLEIPMHEPRGKKGLGLMYAISNRGGCHTQAMHDPDLEAPNLAPEIRITAPLSRLDTSREKVVALKKTQDYLAIVNSLVLCINIYWFGAVHYRPVELVDLLNAATGWDYDVGEFMVNGERINTLCRAFNVREGISRKDDNLPQRLKEPLEGGPTEGQTITDQELNRMLSDYYDLCGWDPETGIPTKTKLGQLGLTLVMP